jgi:hypothetical protein
VKAPARIALDFADATPNRAPVTGMALFGVGLLACVIVATEFSASLGERESLQARLGSIARPHRAPTAADTRNAAVATTIQKQLWVPWSSLLAELETASQDVSSTVSLLEVQPDAAKHVVRITAEARTLPDALAYLERLQKSTMLRYPMLDSHELRKDDPEHPVRVKLSAEWRT